jgi:hypothetical protein
MHSVNLDLLRATAVHHSDGRPKDPHARHRAEHLSGLRAARRARWLAVIARVLGVLPTRTSEPETCAQVVVPRA